MIYCVWYPSGGFGHFVNAILTMYGNDFVRPNKTLKFSPNGNSHDLDLVVPKYQHDHWPSRVEFQADKNYCVLIDNGIQSVSEKFRQTFPQSTVIRICYSDQSWPVVARTMIDKAMQSNIETQLPIDNWSNDQPWARREKYFLFLRDHELRSAWRPTNDFELHVENLFSYNHLYETLNSVVKISPFEDLWVEWRRANGKYIDPIEIAQQIIASLDQTHSQDLTNITDLWTQAVVYYYIWINFGVEVPHNDFADFFTSTDQIKALVL